jgi:hypothetical protein
MSHVPPVSVQFEHTGAPQPARIGHGLPSSLPPTHAEPIEHPRVGDGHALLAGVLPSGPLAAQGAKSEADGARPGRQNPVPGRRLAVTQLGGVPMSGVGHEDPPWRTRSKMLSI